MNLLKTTTHSLSLLALSRLALSLLALSLFASANIAAAQSAQSTVIQDHDHSEHEEQSTALPVMNLDGVFSEIEGDHVLGSPTAPITMIIYASVTCPHCASWFNSVWPDIKNNYVKTNKVRVALREIPTPPVNIAVIGFQIANCAPEDQFFDMIEHQMKEQDNIFTSLKAGTGKATYLEIAKKAGLADEAAMNTCIQSEAGYNRLDKSSALMKAAGLKGVPNFIINGKVLKQSSDYLPLSKHLNKLLAQGYSPISKP